MSSRPRLITPPQESVERSPYRPVWRSLQIETTALFVIMAGVYALIAIAGVELPALVERPAEVALALVPLSLWLVFSLLPERAVPEPRERLLAVAVVAGLAANALGLPLVNDFFQIERWLPLSSAVNRILGYTFTAGVVEALIVYAAVYYVSGGSVRVRSDAAAYGLAAGVGYASASNLSFILSSPATMDNVALRVFNDTALHLAVGLLIGYGVGETRIGRPTPLLMLFTVALAATLTGAVVPVRAGLVNANLTLGTASTTNPLQGVAVSAAVLLGVAIVAAFLIGNAERQEREAAEED